jgi:hypothetical protein
MESVKAWSRVRDRSGGKGEGKGEIAVTDLSRTGTTRALSSRVEDSFPADPLDRVIENPGAAFLAAWRRE